MSWDQRLLNGRMGVAVDGWMARSLCLFALAPSLLLQSGDFGCWLGGRLLCSYIIIIAFPIPLHSVPLRLIYLSGEGGSFWGRHIRGSFVCFVLFIGWLVDRSRNRGIDRSIGCWLVGCIERNVLSLRIPIHYKILFFLSVLFRCLSFLNWIWTWTWNCEMRGAKTDRLYAWFGLDVVCVWRGGGTRGDLCEGGGKEKRMI